MRAAIAGAAALALLSLSSPAAAQVVVVPAEAVQGDAADLTFRISNESAAASITQIEVRLPEEAPIAEVYPLSVENWTPSITMRTLDKPLASLHGPPLTDATSAVTWTAVPGKELPPGGTTELSLAVGPLPSVERLAIGVVLTNSDGTLARWTRLPTTEPTAPTAVDERPAPVLTLRAAAGDEAQATNHAATPAATRDSGRSYFGWVLGTLLLVATLTIIGLVLQRRTIAVPEIAVPKSAVPKSVVPETVVRADPAGAEPTGLAASQTGPTR
jgi:uncharacterized protein YcnI